MENIDLEALKKSADAKPRVNVGIIGDVAIGKRGVILAITKVLTDKGLAQIISNDEEGDALKMTIEVNHTEYSMDSMITGSVQMNVAILVVNAHDGPMPHTKADIELARQANVPASAIVVFLDKCDEVEDNELLDLEEMETSELLKQYGFPVDKTPVIRGSALKALGDDKEGVDSILKLMEAVERISLPQRIAMLEQSVDNLGVLLNKR
ncbi:MAG: hypothetical protein LBN20_03610 [Endomicrobium sp.]|jgi:elongation factor Tu|nr:hypothetical protein [Endomicrobium sp.]